MSEETSLPALLKLLLSLPDDTPVFATPSFERWGAFVSGSWPPPSEGRGLRLVDTRDRAARQWTEAWTGDPERPDFQAALVLGRTRLSPLPRLRRVVRDLRNPGTRRLDEARLNRILSAPHVRRLGFRDDLGVPASFSLAEEGSASGTAFLLSRSPPFRGEVWDVIRDHLGTGGLQVRAFHLRIRGAAVAPVATDRGDFVVRLVKNASLKERVRENHASLERLRNELCGSPALLTVIPRPVFATSVEGTLILGETALPGTLAWKLQEGPVEGRIHREAVRFLERMRDETKAETPLGPGEIRALLDDDVRRLDEANVIEEPLRRLVRAELHDASEMQAGGSVVPSASHGDYGYGNILVDPESGDLRGVIDWDTARLVDLPGIDRVNLEIQIRRSVHDQRFCEAVRWVWSESGALQELAAQLGPGGARRVFGVAVARYVIRSFPYPSVFRDEANDFLRTLTWLRGIPAAED